MTRDVLLVASHPFPTAALRQADAVAKRRLSHPLSLTDARLPIMEQIPDRPYCALAIR